MDFFLPGTQRRVGNPQGEVTSTFEDPATGVVLESLFATPANPAQDVTGSTDYDLCQSITSSTLPANPYTKWAGDRPVVGDGSGGRRPRPGHRT